MKCDTCQRKTSEQCTCCKCVAAGKALYKPSWDIRNDCIKCGLNYSTARILKLRESCPHYLPEKGGKG